MMEKYQAILHAVMQIIEEDYAGQPECASRNEGLKLLEAFTSAWEAGILDDELFVRYMAWYVAGLGDSNLSFEVASESAKQTGRAYTCGISGRRFCDELCVVKVCEDERFVLGDALVLLDGQTPDEYLEALPGNPVNGNDLERQLWDSLVAYCSHVTVRHADGSEEGMAIKHFPCPSFVASLKPPTVNVVEAAGDGDETAVIIAVHHFVDGSVLEVMRQHFADIQRANRVIVDVRDASEGMIGNAYPLMALFFDREINLKNLMGQEFVYTRYSERNARLRIRQLERMLARSDESGRPWVQAEIDHVSACAGQGFVKEAEFEEDMLFPPAPKGQKTYLLTDVHTAGPAERLAAVAQRASEAGCGKVCRVGRATRGGLDYSNLVAVAFSEELSLVYPISKTEAAHEGRGMRGRGIVPDVYVPFTPSECLDDLVLREALSR